MMSGYVSNAIISLATILSMIGCATGEGKSTIMNTVDSNTNATAQSPNTPRSETSTQDEQGYPVRGEINKTYQLSPDARVEISGVEGPVEVETTDGGVAEIHLVRMARTQADYDCDKIDIQHTPGNLVLRHQQDKQCQIIHARESLKLVVPRSANLSFKQIEGELNIGVTDGVLRLDSIEGFVKVAKAQSAEIRSLEKGLSLSVARLDAQGINISQVEGSVELGLSSDVNADLSISAYSGDIKTEIPDAQASNSGRKGYKARIGSGGANISISHIEGDIRIRRN
jgi:Putative adhesin